MERATSRSRRNPAGVQWLPRASSRTIRANFSKSACLAENIGLRSKNGITRSSRSPRLRTTRTSARSCLLFGLMRPHPNLARINSSTWSSVAILADVELRDELKSDPAGRVALHRDREASFSVDVTRDIAIQPFLLIVRTRHVVTT